MNTTAKPCLVKVAVVIPCYKVRRHILDVLQRISPVVHAIFVVDDACPEGSGGWVAESCTDPRVQVIRHEFNQGVGGAVLSGYKAALEQGYTVLVKIDGDGQMDPRLIERFIAPICNGQADYTKGNRFFDLASLRQMPALRLWGNAGLSLLNKLSSGYWDIFDPTNGYTAIHARVAQLLPADKLSKRYFFESDMLFRLNTLRAVVQDVPMEAVYGDEVSNLRVRQIFGEFFGKHVRNFFKRLFYNYYLRDMSVASIELPLGVVLLFGGGAFGAWHWWQSALDGVTTPAGTVMLSALPMLMGLQLILAFLAFDIANVPRLPLHQRLLLDTSPQENRERLP